MDDETIKISALLKRIEALELLIAGKDMMQERRSPWNQWDNWADRNLKTAEQIVNEKTFEWKDNIQKLDESNKLHAQKCKEQVEKQKQEKEHEEKQAKERMEEHMYQQAIIKARVDARVRAQAHILEEEAKQELIKNKN